ncbi:MAG: hypothetical protein J4F30_04080 [Acidobacteria bacterium]|nr:hypothetical protein [Acidobacteriota bacterium]
MQTVRAEFPLDPELDLNGTWRRLRDLSSAHMYVPGLTAVSFVGAQREGVGTHRRVRMRGILTMDETVTEWREGEGMTLRLNRGDKGPLPPLREHFFDYGLSERDGRVWLVNRMRYEVGLGPLGTLLDGLLLHREIGRQLRDVTLAQKIFYETGRKVTPAMLRAAKSRPSARE